METEVKHRPDEPTWPECRLYQCKCQILIETADVIMLYVSLDTAAVQSISG